MTTFHFDTNYLYFNESVLFSSSPIILSQTFIPTWDYSLNNSHMTDFSDYSLLLDIASLSGVKLSRSGVNITIPDIVNYSSRNLLSEFTTGSSYDSVWFNLSISNFSVNLSLPFADNYTLFVDGDEVESMFSVVGDVLSGENLMPGHYRFVDASPKGRVVMGRFGVHSLVYSSIINYNSFLIHTRELNGLHNYYNYPTTYLDFGYTHSRRQLFYYSGNLFNNNQEKELIN